LFQYTGLPNSYELLQISSGKVYRVAPGANCYKNLFYDFDLEVGETFDGSSIGVGMLFVTEKSTYNLLNNEPRRYLKLTNNLASPSLTVEWVEGIGDIQRGLLPFFPDFEGYDIFVCARDANSELLSPTSPVALCDSFSCQVPYAGFQFAKSDKVVAFTNTSINASVYWWNFGDGTTSTEQHPVHEYATPGCYMITLKAYTNCLANPNIFIYSVNVCLNGGWEPKPMPVPETGINITFVNDSIGYIIAQGKLFGTKDGADTWQQEMLPPDPVTGNPVVTYNISMINQDSGMVWGRYSGSPIDSTSILFTVNGGENWTSSFIAEPDAQFTGIAMLPGGHAAVTDLYHSIFFSDDYGQHWNKVNYPNFGFTALTHAINVIRAGNAFCIYGFIESFSNPTPSFPFLFFTNDNGITWKTVPLYGEQTTYGVFFLNELNGWVTGKNGILLHTIDGGQTWEHIATGALQDLHDVEFSDLMNGWTVGVNGTILHTTDGGQTWLRENCESSVFFSKIATGSQQTSYTLGGSATLLKYQPYGTSPCEFNLTQEYFQKNPTDWTIVPNPATSHIEVTIGQNFPVEHEMVVTVFNAWGQEIQETYLSGYSGEIDLTGLPAGIYFVSGAGQNLTLTGKVFVKM
jgi:photosystem II stability/assembly factor-like uncharacterized protein